MNLFVDRLSPVFRAIRTCSLFQKATDSTTWIENLEGNRPDDICVQFDSRETLCHPAYYELAAKL
jgi:hypothetical protein